MIHLPNRARAKPPSVFDEISGDLDNRWEACVALTAEVWGRGLRACSCQAERTEWLGRTADYFEQARAAFLAGYATIEDVYPEIVLEITERTA